MKNAFLLRLNSTLDVVVIWKVLQGWHVVTYCKNCVYAREEVWIGNFYQLTCEECMKVASRLNNIEVLRQLFLAMLRFFSIYSVSWQINSCKLIAMWLKRFQVGNLFAAPMTTNSIESDNHHLLIMLFIAFFNVPTCVHHNLKRHMSYTWECHADDTWRGNWEIGNLLKWNGTLWLEFALATGFKV